MINQYRKIVYLDERGRSFEVQAKKDIILEAMEEPGGKLVIRALNISHMSCANPPIPEGWKHISGEWNNGYVIKRDKDGSEMVWVPVQILDADGTLDGKAFCEKFGRRYYRENEIAKNGFHEKFEGRLVLQAESIEKYGGFYISRYEISKSGDQIHSVKDVMPLNNISFYEAMKLAKDFENTEKVKSHIPYGAEYDSVLAWFIKSKARTVKEIAENSAEWGNFPDAENALNQIARTGSNENWCTNGIYDLAGNLDEWTQEECRTDSYVTRSGHYSLNGHYYPACYRNYRKPGMKSNASGFRVVLFLK